MANTVHGPYAPLNWVNGSSAASQTNMNHLETGPGIALASFNPDLIGAGFVLKGVTPTRHNSFAANVASLFGANLLRYYHLDETSGAVAYDSSANAQNGVFVAGPTLGAASLLIGDPDKALGPLNGTSQYVSLPTAGLPTGAGAWTLLCLCKPTNATNANNGPLVTIGNPGTTAQAAFITQHSSGGWDIGTWGGATHDFTANGTTIAGHVYFVAGTFDGTSLRLYVGDITANALSPTLYGPFTPTAPNLVENMANIGADTATSGRFFAGVIGQPVIANTALSQTNLNTLYTAAITATAQLDLASGTAYLVQSDNTVARCDVVATNFATVTASTTYFLDLNPDGSWSWGTSHSGVANHITIASVTTDGSGNFSGMTDLRTLAPTLLPGALGAPAPNANVGPLQAFATTSAAPTGPGAILTSVKVKLPGVYLFSVYLVGSGASGTFAPTLGMQAYQNGVQITGQGNASAAAQSPSGAQWTASLAWSYVVTCAAGDTLELWYSGTLPTSPVINGQCIAQFIHA